jgi:hypothetical protein
MMQIAHPLLAEMVLRRRMRRWIKRPEGAIDATGNHLS